MHRFSLKLTIAVITFFIGCLAVSFWFLNLDKKLKNSEIPAIQFEVPIAEINEDQPENNSTEEENPLDSLWIEKDITFFNGYTIKRYCDENQDVEEPCKLKVSQGNKVLDEFYSHNKEMLQYGFFNFLGESEKQLIIHTYSGGAHCCYDYYIYDLKPNFRKIYDSSKFSSVNEIGDDLFPIDIDKDGVFEFRQDVMAFDYMAPGGHATATFPPAIFQFNKKKSYFELANKKFPNFVLDELKKNIDGLAGWAKDQEKYGTKIKQEEIDEITVRDTFLYWIYAGKREEAWKLFEEKYDFKFYKFRDKFREDFKNIFTQDPTYLSIYGK